jgi:hypothetical protein
MPLRQRSGVYEGEDKDLNETACPGSPEMRTVDGSGHRKAERLKGKVLNQAIKVEYGKPALRNLPPNVSSDSIYGKYFL